MEIKRYISSAVLFAMTVSAVSAADKRPNILFFLVDDMGWQETSVAFYKERTALNNIYHTPNMERLAARGMKFTQAYACPLLSPTRVSLMTGQNLMAHRAASDKSDFRYLSA